MICPDCHGDKQTIASHVRYADGRGAYNVTTKCCRCDGAGECLDEMAEWIKAGARMREARMRPVYRNLCDEAARRGISVVELSQMEHGKIKPQEQ